MGKSFEIRPTGVAHAELLLPSDWAPSYPVPKDSVIPDKVKEHFSWKKVTTNISGFILGSPTIDHYGDMTVRYSRLRPLNIIHSIILGCQSSHRRQMCFDVQTPRVERSGRIRD